MTRLRPSRGEVKRYGAVENARRIQYGSESTKQAGQLINEALQTGDDTPLYGLTDMLEEHDHPFAHILRRAMAEGIPGDYTRQQSLGMMHAANSPMYPEMYPILNANHTGLGYAGLRYYHLPHGHFFHVSVAEDQKPLEGKSWLLPTTPEEVSNYAEYLRSIDEPELANKFQNAITGGPRIDEYYEHRLRNAGLGHLLQENPPGEPQRGTMYPPRQLSRLRFAKPGSGQTHRVDIKGVPYVLTKNEQGWGVTALDSPISRVSRNYQVFCDEEGSPRGCSCPDNVYRGGVCKHMKAVAEMNRGSQEAPKGELQQEKLSRRRFAAYRAPAGGMVVRGTAYKGGAMVPDMEGEFMNPKKEERIEPTIKLDPSKLAKARSRYRTHKQNSTSGATMSMDGTSAPAPSPKRHSRLVSKISLDNH